MAMWTSCGAASLVRRLSCTEPSGFTSRYSISPSAICTFAEKLTVDVFLSSVTVPTLKIPGAISFGAENTGGGCACSAAGFARNGAAVRMAMAIRADMILGAGELS